MSNLFRSDECFEGPASPVSNLALVLLHAQTKNYLYHFYLFLVDERTKHVFKSKSEYLNMQYEPALSSHLLFLGRELLESLLGGAQE